MDFYLNKMSWKDVENALSMFNLPKEQKENIINWIWEKHRVPFEVF